MTHTHQLSTLAGNTLHEAVFPNLRVLDVQSDAELELGGPRIGHPRTRKTLLELGDPRTGHPRTGR